MKARILFLTVSIFATTLFFISCQKDKSGGSTDYTAEASTHADDQSRFSTEIDGVANDANATLELTPGLTAGLWEFAVLL